MLGREVNNSEDECPPPLQIKWRRVPRMLIRVPYHSLEEAPHSLPWLLLELCQVVRIPPHTSPPASSRLLHNRLNSNNHVLKQIVTHAVSPHFFLAAFTTHYFRPTSAPHKPPTGQACTEKAAPSTRRRKKNKHNEVKAANDQVATDLSINVYPSAPSFKTILFEFKTNMPPPDIFSSK